VVDLPEPRALEPERDALFLDFDGTLVEIAPTPDSVQVPPALVPLLQALTTRLGGALAVITGRPVADVDRFLDPCRPAIAGVHGRDRRLPDGRRERVPVDPGLLDEARARFAAFTARIPGTRVEDKGESVALHFRQAPEAGEAALAEARALAEASGGRLRLQAGKMVAELVPAGHDKGTAIEEMLGLEPFRGRTPVFAGDDVTDEAAFAAVNRLDGLSVRVGDPAATVARSRLPDVAALHGWLAGAASATFRPKQG
jgi:trehalose 6-phosphate phosphatase